MDMLSGLHHYQFEYFAKFFDYNVWLSGCYNDLVGISSCHYFHFTQEGVHAYVDDLENRLSQNPIIMIHSNPTAESPPYLLRPPISNERIKKFRAAKKPPDTESFWNDLIQGGLGTTQPKLINPVFINHVSYLKLDEEKKQDESSGDMEIEECQVKKFRKLIPDYVNDCYRLETLFSDGTSYILNERKDFIDEDGTINIDFQQWENKHPQLKKRFLSRPSLEENKKKKKSDKVNIPKRYVGSLLSDGRVNG